VRYVVKGSRDVKAEDSCDLLRPGEVLYFMKSSVMSWRAVSAERPGLAPIYFRGRRSWVSATGLLRITPAIATELHVFCVFVLRSLFLISFVIDSSSLIPSSWVP
jgi:hypothetical protein